MSRIEFSNLRTEYPDFARVLESVESWIQRHRRVEYIDPARIANDVREVSRDELDRILSVLVSFGKLRRAYRVRPRSTHTLVDQVFSSIKDIPPQLTGTFNEVIPLEDAEIVPVYGRPTEPIEASDDNKSGGGYGKGKEAGGTASA